MTDIWPPNPKNSKKSIVFLVKTIYETQWQINQSHREVGLLIADQYTKRNINLQEACHVGRLSLGYLSTIVLDCSTTWYAWSDDA